MTCRIELDSGTVRHRPREVVAGTVIWAFPAAPFSAKLGLWWRTEGKGTAEAHEVSVERFDNPGDVDQRSFHLRLPTMPYSFSGQKLSIVWRVEFHVRLPRKRREKVEVFRVITMSPTGEAIDPYR